MERKEIIRIENLTRQFTVGNEIVKALNNISFSISEGEFVSIMGTSGSGKSTLLNILGCLDKPTSGEYFINGTSVNNLSRNQLSTIRNRQIGFVFQNYNLLARTSALENVQLPLLYNSEVSAKERKERAIAALEAVKLTDRMHHAPNQL
ncbi:MAG TPA: ATP-binding cassette domain-containing protein, partial [Bacteroidales bacterium]|nr:ATP-binding cassette domain-containing protein [Bacteroidales bacterium]